MSVDTKGRYIARPDCRSDQMYEVKHPDGTVTFEGWIEAPRQIGSFTETRRIGYVVVPEATYKRATTIGAGRHIFEQAKRSDYWTVYTGDNALGIRIYRSKAEVVDPWDEPTVDAQRLERTYADYDHMVRMREHVKDQLSYALWRALTEAIDTLDVPAEIRDTIRARMVQGDWRGRYARPFRSHWSDNYADEIAGDFWEHVLEELFDQSSYLLEEGARQTCPFCRHLPGAAPEGVTCGCVCHPPTK